MQKLAASILLIAFLGQTFNQGWYYLDYMIQRKEYMKRCVNKARPAMHCNGKCQLMKKIREAEEKERGQAPEMKLAKLEIISSRSFFPGLTAEIAFEMKRAYCTRNFGTPIDRSNALFHPPGAFALS